MVKCRTIGIAAFAVAFAPLCVSQLLNAPPNPLPRRPNSLDEFRIGEQLLQAQNYQSAAIHFQSALNGDGQPSWTAVWSHIDLGRVFDLTGQHDRARTEYQFAVNTNDDTLGAMGIAKAARLEGIVMVETSLDSEGHIVSTRVKTSLGLGLDEAAANAVRQWTFAPATRRGLPIPDVAYVEVNFRLPGLPGWHVKKIEFAPPAQSERPALMTGTRFMPDKMPPDLAEEAGIDAAMRRIPEASISMDIDAAGAPANVKVNSASLPDWGEDAVRAIREWRFASGAGAVPCSVDLAWYPAASR